MFGVVEASAAFSGIKAAADVVKGLNALKSEAEINAAQIEIQRMLLEAQAAALDDKEKLETMSRRVHQLEEQLISIEHWDREKARYVLTESSHGAFTYNLRSESANGEAQHRVCVSCINEGKKSVLQTKHKHSGGEIVHCPRCDKDLTLSPFQNTIDLIENENRRDWSGW